MIRVEEENLTEVLVQCNRCHSLLTIEAAITGQKIRALMADPHIIRDPNHKGLKYAPPCHCGGQLSFFKTNPYT